MWNQTNLFSLFEILVEIFDKIVIQVYLVIFVNIIKVMFNFYNNFTQKNPQKLSQVP